jgi:hypothetical protein
MKVWGRGDPPALSRYLSEACSVNGLRSPLIGTSSTLCSVCEYEAQPGESILGLTAPRSCPITVTTIPLNFNQRLITGGKRVHT